MLASRQARCSWSSGFPNLVNFHDFVAGKNSTKHIHTLESEKKDLPGKRKNFFNSLVPIIEKIENTLNINNIKHGHKFPYLKRIYM